MNKQAVRLSVLGIAVLSAFHNAASQNIYGSGINGDQLANIQVGGTDCSCVAPGAVASFRFRATSSSSLQAFRIYTLQRSSGYGSGTYGTLRVDLQTDDGSANHFPSGTTLSSVSITNIGSLPQMPEFTMNSPALTAGQIYHLVFTNTDPNPSLNFTSVNTLYMNAALTQMQPRFVDSDWTTLEKQSAGGYLPGQWYVRREMTPIMELTYADGTHSGMGYIELWLPPKDISGVSSARETLTVSGPSVTVSGIAVRVQRTSGASPLTLRLEQGDGTLVEAGSVPAANVSTASPVWVTYTFLAAHSLTSGQSYHLTLTAASDTIYSVFPMYKGVAFGFTSSSYFGDGYAQYNNGAGWSGWSTLDGQTNRTTGDLQFYFVHSPTPPTNLQVVVQ